MRFENEYGQSGRIARLAAGARSGRIVHALLLAGPEGVGKRTLAARVAQTLHCQAQQEERPCNECPACKRFLSENHPDALRVYPEKASIGVDVVRELVAKLSVKPYEGRGYTVRIERADRMTPQAQNALLKTLEDPPGEAVFLLTADAPQALLATIRSRCREIPLAPAPIDTTARLLRAQGIAEARAQELAALSGGLIGRALALAQDEAHWKAFDAARKAMLNTKSPADMARVTGEIGKLKEQAAVVLEAWETLLRDMLLIAIGAEEIPPFHSDIPEALRARAADFTARHIECIMESVVQASRRLKQNVAWAAVSEEVLWCLFEPPRTHREGIIS